MKKGIMKGIIALVLVLAMSAGMVVSADDNSEELDKDGTSVTRSIFHDQRNATYPIHGAYTEWGGNVIGTFTTEAQRFQNRFHPLGVLQSAFSFQCEVTITGSPLNVTELSSILKARHLM